jgi:hypothetical protein
MRRVREVLRLRQKAKGADPNWASRGAAYPSEIIPECRAKSFWNAERHQIGMLGDIIADSRATCPGIAREALSRKGEYRNHRPRARNMAAVP